MASLITIEKLLDSALESPLLELGFRRAERLIFARELADTKQLLRFPTRQHSNIMLFNANVGIRFEKIERLLGNEDTLSPTLMMPVHLLRPMKEHLEWQLDLESSQRVIDDVLADCRQYFLPFLKTMSTMEALKLQLLYEIDYYANTAVHENDERLRLVLSPEQRIQKLAAIYLLEGEREVAEHLIDSELTKLGAGKQLPPQIALRLRWERLKKAFFGSGENV